MKVIKYNKLIRDNIPQIITESGKSFSVEKLNDEEYILKLKEKLIEEANEVKNADVGEIKSELADVLEITEAIEKYYCIDHKDVLSVKEKKAMKNGKFEKRLLLKEVIEDDQ